MYIQEKKNKNLLIYILQFPNIYVTLRTIDNKYNANDKIDIIFIRGRILIPF